LRPFKLRVRLPFVLITHYIKHYACTHMGSGNKAPRLLNLRTTMRMSSQ
jgi:hypothetical protein